MRMSKIGDLHDGSGLSDSTTPNGLVSNPIFEQVDYDLLTIGPTYSLFLCIIFTESVKETMNSISPILPT